MTRINFEVDDELHREYRETVENSTYESQAEHLRSVIRRFVARGHGLGPRDGESADGSGSVRPVPPCVDPDPETEG